MGRRRKQRHRASPRDGRARRRASGNRDREKEHRGDHHEEDALAADDAAGTGCGGGPAAAGRDGAAAHGAGQDAGHAGPAARVRLHPERRVDEPGREQLEARGHRPGLRALAHPVAACAAPRPPHGRERPRPAAGGGVQRRRRRPLARERGLPERGPCRAGAGGERARRDDGRPDRRRHAGAGHAAAVAGTGRRQRRHGRQLRQRLRLRLPQHDLLADAHDAAPDRAEPGRGLRAALRRRRHRGRAARRGAYGPQHPRRRERRHRRATAGGGAGRPRPGGRVPGGGAGDRAPAADGGPDRGPRAAAVRAPDGDSRGLRRARRPDVRPAVAGVPGGRHARDYLHARPGARRPVLPRARHPHESPRALPPPGRSGEPREPGEDQHVSRGAVRRVRGEAQVDAGRGRLPAGPRETALRRRDQQSQPARALRPSHCAGGRCRAAGRTASRDRGDAAGQPAAGDAGLGRRFGGRARDSTGRLRVEPLAGV